jgi:hypothetical protein
MTTALSHNEQHYLVRAFDSSPTAWFLPRQVARDEFSDRVIDQIVESLGRRGLMDGQLDCHARLTDLGRKIAAELTVLSKRDWPKFHKRRKVRIALATAALLVSLTFVVLRTAGVL